MILNCGLYQQIGKKSGFYLMHCFLKSFIVIRRYHHFAPRAANHCCQSLTLEKPLDWYTALRVNSIMEYKLCLGLMPYNDNLIQIKPT